MKLTKEEAETGGQKCCPADHTKKSVALELSLSGRGLPEERIRPPTPLRNRRLQRGENEPGPRKNTETSDRDLRTKKKGYGKRKKRALSLIHFSAAGPAQPGHWCISVGDVRTTAL